jgi:PAS domain S-box-containing protein
LLADQARRALETSEKRFRALAESAGDAIVTADSAGRITFWNPAAARIFGYAHEEAVGRPLTLILPERFWEAHGCRMKRVNCRGRQAQGGGSPGAVWMGDGAARRRR